MPDGTRQRLIACAVTVLAAEGVDAVTIRRVAREAGVSHGAPLRHFPNREALLSAVAASGFSRVTASIAPSGDPVSALVSACESYVDFGRREPALFALMARYPDESLVARFRSLVADVQATGWRSAADPGLLAASLWASLNGLVLTGSDALETTLDVYLRETWNPA
ncbi:TetR/AcrR family transcriptional regulator [Actinocrispum sp. NPDC049592]|uniref:TetR/AcrR family transcriptional regulator n=1 Tax=Actinocrispum sp. NPDC049592 TaxID=3154835 RepID=UPI00343E320F